MPSKIVFYSARGRGEGGADDMFNGQQTKHSVQNAGSRFPWELSTMLENKNLVGIQGKTSQPQNHILVLPHALQTFLCWLGGYGGADDMFNGQQTKHCVQNAGSPFTLELSTMLENKHLVGIQDKTTHQQISP